MFVFLAIKRNCCFTFATSMLVMMHLGVRPYWVMGPGPRRQPTSQRPRHSANVFVSVIVVFIVFGIVTESKLIVMWLLTLWPAGFESTPPQTDTLKQTLFGCILFLRFWILYLNQRQTRDNVPSSWSIVSAQFSQRCVLSIMLLLARWWTYC